MSDSQAIRNFLASPYREPPVEGHFFGGISSAFSSVGSAIGGAAESVGSAVGGAAEDVGKAVADTAEDAGKGTVKGLTVAGKGLQEGVKQIDKVDKMIEGVPVVGEAYQVGKAFAEATPAGTAWGMSKGVIEDPTSIVDEPLKFATEAAIDYGAGKIAKKAKKVVGKSKKKYIRRLEPFVDVAVDQAAGQLKNVADDQLNQIA